VRHRACMVAAAEWGAAGPAHPAGGEPRTTRAAPDTTHLYDRETMTDDRRYTDADGREWLVTLDAPGKLLAVEPSLERSGANLPEHQIRIVFSSGDESFSEEYTAMTALEDLSDSHLDEWFRAARRGHGV
jgi:hypothetical protein